jgi:hypothetical protein
MPTVRAVEQRIYKVEGFRVHILHVDGRDVRGDKGKVPMYPFERALKNSANVRGWMDNRFRRRYPGFKVEVLTSSGRPAHGRMKLATVRDTYLDDLG